MVVTGKEAVVSPAADAYGRGVPRPVRSGIANIATNLGTPSMMVNNLLQGDVEGLVVNGLRFVLNSTIGVAGLFDPAKGLGIEEETTDFGETLYKWGVPEGVYVEVPLLGPSTERHLAGRVVDLFTNPLSYVSGAEDGVAIAFGANVLSGVDQRYEYSSTVDSILYESEDSYAAARRLYLDNRRFELGVETSEEEIDEIDALFAELYGE